MPMIGWLNSDERGASAVLVAASLFLLMGFAALTIDWGAATNQRRQNQSAADFGVLAAAQFANVDAPCGGYTDPEVIAACNATAEAIAVVDGNLGFTPGTLDWAAGCQDEDTLRPAEFTIVSPTTKCVSFTDTFQKVRVVLPIVEVDTTFGQVMGRSEISTSAFAEAQADLREKSKVIPFALTGNAADSTYNCLRAVGGNMDWGVCRDLPNVGNFGSLNVPVYGTTAATSSDADACNPDTTSLISNIVRGVDHPMSTHPNGTASAAFPAKQDDQTGPNAWPTGPRFYVCDIFGAEPNEVDTRMGIGSALDDGMTFGFGATERGRIWGTSKIRNAKGAAQPETLVDDTPLWDFLVENNPSFCPPGPPPDNTARMIECLDNWDISDGIVFEEALGNAPRYGFVPQFWSDDYTPGDPYLIRLFRPVYVNTSYFGCSAGGPSCAIIHAPGEADIGPCPSVTLTYDGVDPATIEPPDTTCGTPNGDKSADMQAITSFILDPEMLPITIRDAFTTEKDALEYALTR